ncbi:putative acetyltransferase [Vitis vinifera]|uniref:Putative acetyltransferase n=1 Tax=Vitis vinifera TaxID=29760 RepID=A0A438ITG2_VITVI|nr:putative acetyltransferase [Vitis vinifera]
MTISDILSPIHVPSVVQSFFDHDRVVNHDAHTLSLSLLSIQVTELLDGIFIGCSANHSIVDGTSFWHFLNAWSEIFNAQEKNTSISRPTILTDGCGPVVSLPFTHHDQFISRFEAPILRERIFHFSSESIAKLKAKANAECNSNKISSFQALSALVWRSITRAHCLPHEQKTICGLAVNNRTRLDPPLARELLWELNSDGREGGGSIDLEVCLTLNSMSALESNPEFMEAVSISS